jgi:hypothetical protein
MWIVAMSIDYSDGSLKYGMLAWVLYILSWHCFVQGVSFSGGSYGGVFQYCYIQVMKWGKGEKWSGRFNVLTYDRWYLS